MGGTVVSWETTSLRRDLPARTQKKGQEKTQRGKSPDSKRGGNSLRSGKKKGWGVFDRSGENAAGTKRFWGPAPLNSSPGESGRTEKGGEEGGHRGRGGKGGGGRGSRGKRKRGHGKKGTSNVRRERRKGPESPYPRLPHGRLTEGKKEGETGTGWLGGGNVKGQGKKGGKKGEWGKTNIRGLERNFTTTTKLWKDEREEKRIDTGKIRKVNGIHF